MNKIIQSLIENAHSIYNLYRKIKDTEDRQEKETFFKCLEYLISKEEKYLDQLQKDYSLYLEDIYFEYLNRYDLNNINIMENYIVLNGQSLALVRILEKLKTLVRENPIVLPEYDEDGDLALKEDEEIVKFFDSEEDCILDTVCKELELETCIRFMNISTFQNPRKNVLKEKMKLLPYEITYLNSILEQLFLKDRVLNFPSTLFKTEIMYETLYDSILLKSAIENYWINLATIQIKALISKRQTRTKQVAFLRSLYINSLLHNLEKEKRENFLADFRSEIQEIPYQFALVKKLKKQVSHLYIEDEKYDLEAIEEDKES